MSLGYHPLVYMWIAEYSDGSALPQFDPETGKENMFRDIDFKRLKRFGWYPFTPELADKIFKTEGIIVIPTSNPPRAIELKRGETLVAKRENILEMELRGGVSRGETIYVLGIEGGNIIRINENGNIEV